MKSPSVDQQTAPRWNPVLYHDIQAAVELEVARFTAANSSKRKIAPELLPELRRALLNVFQDDQARLDSFVQTETKWLIRCSVTDSVVSGVWGIKSLIVGERGYFYYHPDLGTSDGDKLPIIATWAPPDDRSAALASFLEAYILYWKEFVLPPSRGQWARGPVEFLTNGVGAVLRHDPSVWPQVLRRLQEDVREEDSLLGFLTERASSITKQAGPGVQETLERFLVSRESTAKMSGVAAGESDLLVAAFVARIGMGGF